MRRASKDRARGQPWNAAVLENTLFDLLGEPLLLVARDCSLLDLQLRRCRVADTRVGPPRRSWPPRRPKRRGDRAPAAERGGYRACKPARRSALTMALPSYDGRAPALAVLSPLQRGESRRRPRHGRPDPRRSSRRRRRRHGRRAARPVRPDPGRGANRGRCSRSAAAGDRGSSFISASGPCCSPPAPDASRRRESSARASSCTCSPAYGSQSPYALASCGRVGKLAGERSATNGSVS